MQSVAPPRSVAGGLALAGRALAAGEPVLIYDAPDREGETDLVLLSERATPELLRLLRRDAGGLICTAIGGELRARLGLPYAEELLRSAAGAFPLAGRLAFHRPRYDRRSAFGLTVNHRSNFTGVTDNDRAATVRAIGELARDAPGLGTEALRERFAHEFASPGHVPLLYAAPGLLDERKGHTELAISLARMTQLTESVTVCEMLGDSGGARDPEAAAAYAGARGWAFLDGATILEAWRAWSA
jgi:3,4-dihydroxy 2-butanone 4-phosphate synthase